MLVKRFAIEHIAVDRRSFLSVRDDGSYYFVESLAPGANPPEQGKVPYFKTENEASKFVEHLEGIQSFPITVIGFYGPKEWFD